MSEPVIAENVLRLVDAAIDSVADLEAILLLAENPSKHWNAALVAGRLYLSEAEAALCLERLKLRGIAEPASDGCFRYLPASPELAADISDLRETYRTQLITLTKLIHSKHRTSAQKFSDAFRLWK
jgi:hypothetical protein